MSDIRQIESPINLFGIGKKGNRMNIKPRAKD
jgi:hypothetical protein